LRYPRNSADTQRVGQAWAPLNIVALATSRQTQKADSTLGCSQAVPHPSTNRALCRLTSEVRRDPVHSTRYGRRRNKTGKKYEPSRKQKREYPMENLELINNERTQLNPQKQNATTKTGTLRNTVERNDMRCLRRLQSIFGFALSRTLGVAM
jgi:hypothetical protein